MAGMKFGSTGNESLTWAMNSYLPGLVSERYPTSRIAAFSTGNVYGLCPVRKRGCDENSPLHPVGEYAMSCVGRERIFEHFSRSSGTRVAILRLNYATEMRYGALVDIAQKAFSGQPIPLRMGYLNAIWQGDANNMCLQALAQASSPPFVVNIAGLEVLSVRRVAGEFAARLERPLRLEGTESPDALLSDAGKWDRRSREWPGALRIWRETTRAASLPCHGFPPRSASNASIPGTSRPSARNFSIERPWRPSPTLRTWCIWPA